MPMLNQLLLGCRELKIVPDLQYLVNLEKFELCNSRMVRSRLQGEDKWKIMHIPSVTIDSDDIDYSSNDNVVSDSQ